MFRGVSSVSCVPMSQKKSKFHSQYSLQLSCNKEPVAPSKVHNMPCRVATKKCLSEEATKKATKKQQGMPLKSWKGAVSEQFRFTSMEGPTDGSCWTCIEKFRLSTYWWGLQEAHQSFSWILDVHIHNYNNYINKIKAYTSQYIQVQFSMCVCFFTNSSCIVCVTLFYRHHMSHIYTPKLHSLH